MKIERQVKTRDPFNFLPWEKGCSMSSLLIRHLKVHIVQTEGINPYEGEFLSFCWSQICCFYSQLLFFPSSKNHMIFWSLFLHCFNRSHFFNNNLCPRVGRFLDRALKWELSNLVWPWTCWLVISKGFLSTSVSPSRFTVCRTLSL